MVHLHVHSNYSLLDGGSTVQALVERAKATGMTALALTDHDGLYGAVRFHQAATAAGLRPLLGAEMTLDEDPTTDHRPLTTAPRHLTTSPPHEAPPRHPTPDARHPAPHLILIARSRCGFRNLCRLITEAQLAG